MLSGYLRRGESFQRRKTPPSKKLWVNAGIQGREGRNEAGAASTETRSPAAGPPLPERAREGLGKPGWLAGRFGHGAIRI